MSFKSSNIILLLLALACSSCRPNGIPRPDTPLCTVTETQGECTDQRGDFTLPHKDLMCTSLDGYSVLEGYVDDLEKEVIRLRRRCNQQEKEMFETHKLNENGFNEVKSLKTEMNTAVNRALELMPEGREKAVFKTKIEEAMFFGTKAIAGKDGNYTEIFTY